MTLLLNEGIGCKKDQRSAQLYQDRAKKVSPEIPDLDAAKREGSGWMVVGLSFVALSIFGIALVRHLRR
jgi:hypothetical protein